MVEGGSPPAVIDFPGKARPSAAAPPERSARTDALPSVEELLGLPFLLERLEANSTQVQMWAAFHLVDRWQDETEQFVERMWHSTVPEIRESAVNLIGKHRIERYGFPLLRLLTSNEYGLRVAAGLALGKLQYEPALKPLTAWFETVSAHRNLKMHEYEAAAESLLLHDRRRHWHVLYERLEQSRQNHSVFAALFRLLCRYADEPGEFERLGAVYGQPREVFHDVHLAQYLVDTIGRANVSRYLQSRLNGGYPLPAIYLECLRLLGHEELDPQVQQLIEAMDGCTATSGGLGKFFTIAASLIERLAPNAAEGARMRGFLEGCMTWLPRWEEAILKVREIEYHLLVSLPLVLMLESAERECLARPEEEALRISRIYQSPLLSSGFMRQILTLLSDRGYPKEQAALGKTMVAGWLWDEEKDTLWKLFTDQLKGVDYPFEQTIPQPWGYGIPTLLDRLVQALSERLGVYLQAGRAQSVDYALEVFRHQGSPGSVDLMLERFDDLLNHHYPQFIEVMTHLPDHRFLVPLLNHYREDEYDLERLIRFICDVHEMPYPEAVAQAESQKSVQRSPTTVRLLCPDCETAFQYPCLELYVNEECIEQRQVPATGDLWTPQRFRCKNCGHEVPFAPDEHYLQDLYAELLAARIVHPAQREELGFNRIQTVSFPIWEGKPLNPAKFLALEREVLEGELEAEQEAAYLFELGRFYVEIGQWEPAKHAMQRILAGAVKFPKALYYLGVIAFQERNIYEARVYFSRLIDSCGREEFERDLDNPVDMAHHYLKLLDKREFKRSHFQLITT